jgi:hypothetical protein
MPIGIGLGWREMAAFDLPVRRMLLPHPTKRADNRSGARRGWEIPTPRMA